MVLPVVKVQIFGQMLGQVLDQGFGDQKTQYVVLQGLIF